MSSTAVRSEPPSTARKRWALAATAIGFGVVQLDVSVVNVAIKAIGSGLGGSITALQWVVTTYTLAFASLILSAGALADRLGAKRLFVVGFTLFTLASMVCGAAPVLSVLVAARAVQGVGAAVLVPSSLTLLNHAYPGGAERRRAVGIWAACAAVALALGPLVGGILTDTLGWRAIFFINAPVGALGIVLTIRFAAETPAARKRGFDLPGQALAVLALLALAAATVEGGRYGFGSFAVLAGFGLAAVAAAVFAWVEARSRDPMLPLGMFRSPVFAACTAIGLLINVAFYGLIFVLSLYFQTVRHYSVLSTGAAFVPTTAGVFAGNLLAGRFVRAGGSRRVVVASATVTAASFAGLLITGSDTPFAALVGPLVVLGFGIGVIVPTMTSAQLGSVEPGRSGLASGTLNTARQAGSVVGVALFGSFAANSLVAGLHAALLASVGLAVIVAVLGGFVGPADAR